MLQRPRAARGMDRKDIWQSYFGVIALKCRFRIIGTAAAFNMMHMKQITTFVLLFILTGCHLKIYTTQWLPPEFLISDSTKKSFLLTAARFPLTGS